MWSLRGGMTLCRKRAAACLGKSEICLLLIAKYFLVVCIGVYWVLYTKPNIPQCTQHAQLRFKDDAGAEQS
jgi:hypothetical protein